MTTGSAAREVWTVGRLLQWTTEFFSSKNIESPRLDAEVLLAHTLQLSRLHLYTGFDRPLEATELATFRGLVKRRALREPVAYLVGRKGFFDIELTVSPAVLIPRPETERLVELLRDSLPAGARFLDLCTGSGAIALATLHARADLTAIATDLSAEALAVARANGERLALQDRVQWREGSLFAPVAGQSFAAIACNPPYVEPGAQLEPEVAAFEPALALFADDSGLAILQQVVLQSPHYLDAGGLLVVEFGRGQHAAVCAFATAAGYKDVRVEKDLAGIERVLVARKE